MKIITRWVECYGEKLPNLIFRNLSYDEKVFKEKIQLIVDFIEEHPTLLRPISESTANAPIYVEFQPHGKLGSTARYMFHPCFSEVRFIEIADDLKGDELLDAFVFEIGNALNPKVNLKVNELSLLPIIKAKTATEYADDMEAREFDTYNNVVQFSLEAQKCGLKGFRTEKVSRDEYMKAVQEVRDEAYHGFTHHEIYQIEWLRYKESRIEGWFGKIQSLKIKQLCLLPFYCLKTTKNYHDSLSQKVESLNSEKTSLQAQRKTIESEAAKWVEGNNKKKEKNNKRRALPDQSFHSGERTPSSPRA